MQIRYFIIVRVYVLEKDTVRNAGIFLACVKKKMDSLCTYYIACLNWTAVCCYSVDVYCTCVCTYICIEPRFQIIYH